MHKTLLCMFCMIKTANYSSWNVSFFPIKHLVGISLCPIVFRRPLPAYSTNSYTKYTPWLYITTSSESKIVLLLWNCTFIKVLFGDGPGSPSHAKSPVKAGRGEWTPAVRLQQLFYSCNVEFSLCYSKQFTCAQGNGSISLNWEAMYGTELSFRSVIF